MRTLLFASLLVLPLHALAQETKEAKKAEIPKVELKRGEIKKIEIKKIEVKKVEVKKAEIKKAEPKIEVKKDTPAPAPAPALAVAKKDEPKPAPASQPVVPQVDPDDAAAIVKAIINSAKTGKWALLVGFIMMLLTWLASRLLKDKIPSKVKPWLAIGLSTIAAVSFAIATGVGWLNAIIVGVQTGLTAAGGWSALGQYLPGLRPATASPAAPAAPAAPPVDKP